MYIGLKLILIDNLLVENVIKYYTVKTIDIIYHLSKSFISTSSF
jgi:hypothetical protein